MSSSKDFYQIIKTPLGNIRICISRGAVTALDIDTDQTAQCEVDTEAAKQLRDYFESADCKPNIPIKAQGTAFQQRVWQALCDIPSGTTLTYGELAKKISSSPRAVGQACRKNPIPIFIPCHRVVSASGLGGYAGKTSGKQMAIKRWLLEHERATRSLCN